MKRIILGVMILALALALTALPVFASDPAKIDHGSQLFTSEKCALCHSVAGKGNKKGPLDDVGSRLTVEEIRQWITAPKEMKSPTNRKPRMKTYTNLSDEELEAIVAYVFSLKGA